MTWATRSESKEYSVGVSEVFRLLSKTDIKRKGFETFEEVSGSRLQTEAFETEIGFGLFDPDSTSMKPTCTIRIQIKETLDESWLLYWHRCQGRLIAEDYFCFESSTLELWYDCLSVSSGVIEHICFLQYPIVNQVWIKVSIKTNWQAEVSLGGELLQTLQCIGLTSIALYYITLYLGLEI